MGNALVFTGMMSEIYGCWRWSGMIYWRLKVAGTADWLLAENRCGGFWLLERGGGREEMGAGFTVQIGIGGWAN